MKKQLTVLASALRCIAIGVVVFVAPDAVPADVIVDQSSGETGQFIQSQEFPDLPAYTVSAFDDFTINTTYSLTSLTVFGRTTGRRYSE